jgi:hypothetical protein
MHLHLNPLQANFDNKIQLLGYRQPTISNPQSPTRNPKSKIQNLKSEVVWQAITTPPNLIRFVQIIGPDGQIYSQNDASPDNGHYPTSLWQPGEVVPETITLSLPAGRPPGLYTLHIGLYHPDTGQRLPLLSGGDHVEITHSLFNVD